MKIVMKIIVVVAPFQLMKYFVGAIVSHFNDYYYDFFFTVFVIFRLSILCVHLFILPTIPSLNFPLLFSFLVSYRSIDKI